VTGPRSASALIACEFLGDDDFVMYLGDNFIVGGITGAIDEVRTARLGAQIMLTRYSGLRSYYTRADKTIISESTIRLHRWR
jgi:dTDP-glucose pyrophosphorylase